MQEASNLSAILRSGRLERQPRSQGLSGSGKMRDPGNEVAGATELFLFPKGEDDRANFTCGC